MPRLELFAFRYRDARTGKWVRARYVAERHEIAARYAEYGLIEPPEIREVGAAQRYFTPFPERWPRDELSLDMQPTIDAIERFLAREFLRRYVTYCARRRRFAAMQGAARLHNAIGRLAPQ